MTLFKRAIATAILSFFISATLTPVPYLMIAYQLDKKFHNTAKPTKSKHTIAYNVDSKYTEEMYLQVRNEMGVTYIDDKVRIVNVEQKTSDGSIGFIEKVEVLGVYTQNIIYYDSTELTLKHELAHFFYEKMKNKDRSEMFAQAIEKYYVLRDIIQKR